MSLSGTRPTSSVSCSTERGSARALGGSAARRAADVADRETEAGLSPRGSGAAEISTSVWPPVVAPQRGREQAHRAVLAQVARAARSGRRQARPSQRSSDSPRACSSLANCAMFDEGAVGREDAGRRRRSRRGRRARLGRGRSRPRSRRGAPRPASHRANGARTNSRCDASSWRNSEARHHGLTRCRAASRRRAVHRCGLTPARWRAALARSLGGGGVEVHGKGLADQPLGVLPSSVRGRRIGFQRRASLAASTTSTASRGELEQQPVAGLGVAQPPVVALDRLLRIDQALLQRRGGRRSRPTATIAPWSCRPVTRRVDDRRSSVPIGATDG